MSYKVICPICGKRFEGGAFDNCPHCDWCYQGFESELDENEIDELNHISITKAKENLAKGLNIWGEPLQKK